MHEQSWSYVVTKLRQFPNFFNEKGWKYLENVDSLMIPLRMPSWMPLACVVFTGCFW